MQWVREIEPRQKKSHSFVFFIEYDDDDSGIDLYINLATNYNAISTCCVRRFNVLYLD